MKRSSLTLWLVVLLGFGLMSAGCSLISGSDETADNETLPEAPAELNLTFGGYESTDEPVGFGDTKILDNYTEAMEEDIDDEIAEDPVVVDMLNQPETDVYCLRITWGHLEQEGDSPLDWSGSARVINGAILVRKAILFDAGDYILRPREDRRLVEWTSYTYDHLDGVALMILDPETLPADDAVLNEFTFETGPFTRTFTMAELAGIDTLITVDGDGNAIHFVGKLREPGFCRIGFTRGEWYRRGLDWGEFRGGWIDENGELAGHVQGMWGYDADGRNVLVGKYIDRNGNFLGLLRGTFEAGATPPREGRQGWMRGHCYDESHQVRGTFQGRWKEPRGRGDHGYFQAVWGMECPEFDEEVAG